MLCRTLLGNTSPSKPREKRFLEGKASKAILRRLIFSINLGQCGWLPTYQTGDVLGFHRMAKWIRAFNHTEILGHLADLYAFRPLTISRQCRYRIYTISHNTILSKWCSRWRSIQVKILYQYYPDLFFCFILQNLWHIFSLHILSVFSAILRCNNINLNLYKILNNLNIYLTYMKLSTFSVLSGVEIGGCDVWLQWAKAINSFWLSLASTKNILSFTSLALYSSILEIVLDYYRTNITWNTYLDNIYKRYISQVS